MAAGAKCRMARCTSIRTRSAKGGCTCAKSTMTNDIEQVLLCGALGDYISVNGCGRDNIHRMHLMSDEEQCLKCGRTRERADTSYSSMVKPRSIKIANCGRCDPAEVTKIQALRSRGVTLGRPTCEICGDRESVKAIYDHPSPMVLRRWVFFCQECSIRRTNAILAQRTFERCLVPREEE